MVYHGREGGDKKLPTILDCFVKIYSCNLILKFYCELKLIFFYLLYGISREGGG